MDETNTVQQVPGQPVDTGPMPLDVLQARMTLLERELMDRMDLMRQQLVDMAAGAHPRQLAEVTEALLITNARLDSVRQLRSDW